ncbi:esterase family protein [Pandoraea sp. ISTKB]|uniref:alpha/beta hydrolase n=1 Tax=Pandoraea sp. ISTKB TaxID=1586708 RepID=UPI00147CF815|nr:alpha/beta hydrolase-fold protein [Pandoraea sp. ISTKB]
MNTWKSSARAVARCMKGLLAGVAFAFAVAAPAHAESGTIFENQTIQSKVLGQPVRYAVYLPPDYKTSNRSYPIFYLMHGGGWDGLYEDWFRQGNMGNVLDRMIAKGEIPSMIVVVPDGTRDRENVYATYYMNDADGKFRWEDMFFQEFVPQIEKRYRVYSDRRFRAIGGLSMGGYASLLYSFRHPDMFTAAAAMSAAMRTDQQIVDMDEKGYERRYGRAWGPGLKGKDRINDFERKYNVLDLASQMPVAELSKTRLQFDDGLGDPFVLGNTKLNEILTARGVPHKFILRPGQHDYDFWNSGSENMLRFVGRAFQEMSPGY